MSANILVVDDTQDIRSLLRMFLENLDYSVTEAENGHSALKAVEAEQYQLIILDYHMPDMDGLNVLSVLRKSGNMIPVIMLTADPHQSVAVQCFRTGADDFLGKPFDPDFLEVVVRRVLRNHENTQKRKQAEIALEAELLVSTLKDRLLTNLGHETGTLVHHVISRIGFVETNLAKNEIDKVQFNLQKAKKAAYSLSNLLNRLTFLAKLEAGVVIFSDTMISLDQIVSMVLKKLDDNIIGKNIEPKVDVPCIPIKVDIEHFVAALVEIVGNSVKVSSKGCTFAMTAKTTLGSIIMTIADSGPGIPEAELDSIFHPFTESSLTQSRAGGTGLGLAIARKIILRHKGTVVAKNNPGGGAIFVITLPQS